MTDDSSELVCKFTGRIEKQGNDHVVTLPDTEIDYGSLAAGDIVRISVEASQNNLNSSVHRESTEPSPPVEVGEQLTVNIEDIGDQGDGIARVDRGYVLIVPDTEPGETVAVKVTQTNSNYGFAHPVTDTQDEDNEIVA